MGGAVAVAVAVAAGLAAPARAPGAREAGGAGVDLAAALRLHAPGGLDFGDVYLGQRRTRPVILTNAGKSAVRITAVGLPGAGLSHGLELPFALDPGRSAWFAVTFSPPTTGEVAGALSVVAGAAGAELPLRARGTRLAGHVDVTEAPFHARGDGVTDDTAAFRAAARTGKVMRVPPPPGGAHYRLTGTVAISNSVVGDGPARPLIVMHGATGRWDRALGHGRHVMFLVDRRSGGVPVVISGLHLDGGATSALTMGREHDHLVFVRNSRDVVIENNVLENAAGDCVLVGGETGQPEHSEDVTISGNTLANPWRNALCVVSARRTRVWQNEMRKRNVYVAMVDLEPNPGNGESVEDTDISFNRIESAVRRKTGDAEPYDYGGAIAVNLASTRGQPANRGVRITWNIVKSRFLLNLDPALPRGPWRDIVVEHNTYLGDPEFAADTYERIGLVRLGTHDGGGHPISDVVVKHNRIERAGGHRRGYRDEFRGVTRLTFTDNEYVGSGYAFSNSDCRSCIVSGAP